MGVIDPDAGLVEAARAALEALAAGHNFSVGTQSLPTAATDVLLPILELLAEGRPVWHSAGEFVPDELRPTCSDCGEPLELADREDPESWIHAEDANYFGDHSASRS